MTDEASTQTKIKPSERQDRTMLRVGMTIWMLVAGTFVLAGVIWWLLLVEIP